MLKFRKQTPALPNRNQRGFEMTSRSIMLSVLVVLLPAVVYAQDTNEEFFAAARKGDVAAVKAMVEKGTDINARTKYGATALSYACDKGHVELVKYLLDHGADVNVKDTFYGEVTLGWAI